MPNVKRKIDSLIKEIVESLGELESRTSGLDEVTSLEILESLEQTKIDLQGCVFILPE